MRLPTILLLLAASLAACAQQKTPAAPEVRTRAQLGAVRTLGTTASATLLAEPLPGAAADSDGPAAYRIWSYDPKADRAVLEVPKAGWAAVAGDALITEEDGKLWLHRGGAKRILIAHAAPDFAVDPTGKWLAAVVQHPGLSLDTDLVLLPAIGGPARPLAAWAGSSESRPIFTPDEQAVIFVSGKTGLASLYRVELLGGRVTQLTNLGMRGGAGTLPEGYLPPPPDAASMHFEGSKLVYSAGGKTYRVESSGADR